METRIIKIEATDTWAEKEIADSLIKEDGWGGFSSGIGSKPYMITVQSTVRKGPS